ncbi:hypothetical protein HWV62_24262 [Athelia sp. TMB]|nr:hypothetical protein HWV62_24262 [Athelia sp. TMB]
MLAVTKASLKVLEAGLQFAPIPGLDLIATGLLNIIDVCEAAGDNSEKLEELRSNIQNFHDRVLLPIRSLPTVPPDMRAQIEELGKTLELKVNELARIERKGSLKRIILASDIAARIGSAKIAVMDAIQTFTWGEIIKTRIDAHESLVNTTLQGLAMAEADYLHASKDECNPETRVDIRETIISHLNDPSNRFVWLRGSPGMGKTAISKSIATESEEQKRLAASFFFDKTGSNPSTDSTKLFTFTLARQLADFHPPYRHALFRHLRARRGPHPPSQIKQLNELVIARLDELKDVPFPSSVIVLDGLDECEHGDQNALEDLMELVVELAKLPSSIQLLVSSRPEKAIASGWFRHSQSKSIVVEDLDHILVEQHRADIAKYIQDSLTKIPDRGSPNWPPSQEDIAEFADQCLGVFEIARIRVRFLEKAPASERMDKVLKDLLKPRPSPPGVSQFAQEYLWILRRGFPSPDEVTTPPLESWQIASRHAARTRFRTVIGAILAMRTPLAVKTLSSLLQMEEYDMMSVLNPLSSIINPQGSGIEDGDPGISFYHATSSEFLRGKFNEPGSPVDRAFLFEDTVGVTLSVSCLDFLVKALRPGQLLHLIPSPVLRSHSHSRALEYASAHWAYHLDFTATSSAMLDALGLFLSQSLLAWLEFRWMCYPELPLDKIATVQKHLQGLSASVSVGVRLSPLSFGPPLLTYSCQDFAPRDQWIHGVLSEAFAHWPFEAAAAASEVASGDGMEGSNVDGSSMDENSVIAALRRTQSCTLVVMLAQLSSLAERIRVYQPNFKPCSLFGRVSLGYPRSLELIPNIVERDQTTKKNGYVRCCTLSPQGRLALSQIDGGLQLSQFRPVDDSFNLFPIPGWSTNSLPSFVWLEFVANDQQLIGEDIHGIVWLLNETQIIDKFGPLPAPGPRSCAAASPNGMHVFRASFLLQGDQALPWYDRMVLLDIINDRISLRALPSPEATAIKVSQHLNINPRSLGFSPDGKHVGAFDDLVAHIWSVESAHHLQRCDIVPGSEWIVNPARKLTILQHPTSESQPISSLEASEPLISADKPLVYDLSKGDIDIADAPAVIHSSVFVTSNWEEQKVGPTQSFPKSTVFMHPNGLMVCHLHYGTFTPQFTFVANGIHDNPIGRVHVLHLLNGDHFNLMIGGGTGVITEGGHDEIVLFPPVIMPIAKYDTSSVKIWGTFLR